MKNLSLVLVLLFTFTFIRLSGQTQIESVNYTFGDTITFQQVSQNISNLDLGLPGGNQTWDFSALTADSTFEYYIIDPSESFAQDSFPTATLVIRGSDTDSDTSGNLMVFDTEDYILVSEDQMKTIGSANRDENGQLEVDVWGDEFTNLIFPASLDSSWVMEGTFFESDEEGLIIDSIMLDSLGVTTSYSIKSLVDAWGVLILPQGDFDVVRVKSVYEFGIEVLGFYNGSWQPLTPAMEEYSGLGSEDTATETYSQYEFWTNNETSVLNLAYIELNDSTGNPEYIDFQDIAPAPAPLNIGVLANKTSISIYPNPVSDYLNVSSEQQLEGRFKIFDLQAKVILSGSINSSSTGIQVSSLKNGQYMVQILNDAGLILVMSRFNIIR